MHIYLLAAYLSLGGAFIYWQGHLLLARSSSIGNYLLARSSSIGKVIFIYWMVIFMELLVINIGPGIFGPGLFIFIGQGQIIFIDGPGLYWSGQVIFIERPGLARSTYMGQVYLYGPGLLIWARSPLGAQFFMLTRHHFVNFDRGDNLWPRLVYINSTHLHLKLLLRWLAGWRDLFMVWLAGWLAGIINGINIYFWLADIILFCCWCCRIFI